MSKTVGFSKEERAEMVHAIKHWFRTERDEEIGDIAAETLLEFITDEIGGHFYNRGLYDAQAAVATRMEEVSDSILSLEKRVGR